MEDSKTEGDSQQTKFGTLLNQIVNQFADGEENIAGTTLIQGENPKSRPNVTITANSQVPHKDKNTPVFLSDLPNPFQRSPSQVQVGMSSMEYSPSLTAPHGFFPWVAVGQDLLQGGPSSSGESGKHYSNVNALQATVAARNSAPVRALARILFHHGFIQGLKFPSGPQSPSSAGGYMDLTSFFYSPLSMGSNYL